MLRVIPSFALRNHFWAVPGRAYSIEAGEWPWICHVQVKPSPLSYCSNLQMSPFLQASGTEVWGSGQALFSGSAKCSGGSLEGRLCMLGLLRDLAPPECCWEEKTPQTLPRKQADWGTVRVQLVNAGLVSWGLGPIPNLQELPKVAAGQPPPAPMAPFPHPSCWLPWGNSTDGARAWSQLHLGDNFWYISRGFCSPAWPECV